jgi:hypothetical protein
MGVWKYGSGCFLDKKTACSAEKKIWKYGMQKSVCVFAFPENNIFTQNTFH